MGTIMVTHLMIRCRNSLQVTDEDSGLVQELCDRVAERFAECGVTVGKRYDSVKLHVTLMNTLFR